MGFSAHLGLLYDRVRLDETDPMGPCSTCGDKNSLRYDLGPHHCDCHVITQRETSTKETYETAETHVEKRLKRLWVRIGETLKRLRSTLAGRWWLVWVSSGRKWVLGSSKAVNAVCLAVFDPSTNSALSRQPECAKKFHMGLYGPPHLMWAAI
jgi:hypothetical protein